MNPTVTHSLEGKTADIKASRVSVAAPVGDSFVAAPPLFQHQSRAVEFILKRGGVGALFMDMGTGKTRAALEVFSRLRLKTPGLKMIVICPLSLIEAAWGEDIRKFTGFSYFNAHDEALPQELKEDILIINFEAIILKRNIAFQKFIHGNLLVIDESSKMKNHKAKTTKMLLALRNSASYRIIMSGTPAPNSPLEYWAQMVFLNDYIFNKSFFAFRNAYFHLGRNGQVMNLHGQTMTRDLMRDIMRKGWKYEITKDSLSKLISRIEPWVFRARKEECLDLPEQTDEIRSVSLWPDQAHVYRDMKRDLIAEIRNLAADTSCVVVAQAALTKIMKLREITSGFAIDVEGDAVAIGASAKLDELWEVLEEAGHQQVIIWACFKWDIETIAQELAAQGKTCVTLYSETKHKDDNIQLFKMGAAQYLVANPHSAAHGLTFTNCSTQVFFSLDYSLEFYEQAKARIHRAGQTKKCTYIHLIAKDTIDEQIMRVLRSKGDVNQIVEEYL